MHFILSNEMEGVAKVSKQKMERPIFKSSGRQVLRYLLEGRRMRKNAQSARFFSAFFFFLLTV